MSLMSNFVEGGCIIYPRTPDIMLGRSGGNTPSISQTLESILAALRNSGDRGGCFGTGSVDDILWPSQSPLNKDSWLRWFRYPYNI